MTDSRGGVGTRTGVKLAPRALLSHVSQMAYLAETS